MEDEVEGTNHEGETMLRSNTKSRLGEAAERITDDFKKMAKDAKEVASDQITSVSDALRARVEEKPLQTLFIAAGVGAIFGLFWRFRR
jgi:ElaB/YqjD/DUF883 family membrane-anchored ribosome-binding protein